MRFLMVGAAAGLLLCGVPAPALADPAGAAPFSLTGCAADAPHANPWAIDFSPGASIAGVRAPLHLLAPTQAPAARRPVPVEYSEGYKTRAKIHKISSVATLPLFVANYFVGQDLYKNHTETMKSAHVGLVAGTAVLFGANTVTGAWNLWEGRKDPNHRAKRLTHGILMMAADVGFLATAALAPDSEDHEHGGSHGSAAGASTHRAVALTSMGIATVGYLIMLFGAD